MKISPKEKIDLGFNILVNKKGQIMAASYNSRYEGKRIILENSVN